MTIWVHSQLRTLMTPLTNAIIIPFVVAIQIRVSSSSRWVSCSSIWPPSKNLKVSDAALLSQGTGNQSTLPSQVFLPLSSCAYASFDPSWHFVSIHLQQPFSLLRHAMRQGGEPSFKLLLFELHIRRLENISCGFSHCQSQFLRIGRTRSKLSCPVLQ
jgi:hypothetical protein